MSQAVLRSNEITGDGHRARAARIGAGVAVLAMALIVFGTYADSKASSSQKSGVPFLLVIAAVMAAVVYGVLTPIALRAVATGAGSARRWAVGFTVVAVLSLVVFWTGLPLIAGGAAALTGHAARQSQHGSRAFAAAWWLGLAAAALTVIVTVLGSTVAGH